MKILWIALGAVAVLTVIALAVAIRLALLAGALIGGYEAYLSFGEGSMPVALAWGVLCAFCALWLLGSLFVRRG